MLSNGLLIHQPGNPVVAHQQECTESETDMQQLAHCAVPGSIVRSVTPREGLKVTAKRSACPGCWGNRGGWIGGSSGRNLNEDVRN